MRSVQWPGLDNFLIRSIALPPLIQYRFLHEYNQFARMSRDAAHKEQTLKVLYAELNKLGQNGEYEKAIKTANRSK